MTPAQASNKIKKAFKNYHNRKVYKTLKEALYKAERSVTTELIKRLSPIEVFPLLEAALVRPRMRFRLGGVSFPPIIMYKIFTNTNNVHYFSGHRLVKDLAMRDAFSMMGRRRFSHVYNEKGDVVEAEDVTNQIEYVRYMNTIDELSPQLGGRNNSWREVTFAIGSNQSIVYENVKKSYKIKRRVFENLLGV